MSIYRGSTGITAEYITETTQQTFTCLKSTIGTQVKKWNILKMERKDTNHNTPKTNASHTRNSNCDLRIKV